MSAACREYMGSMTKTRAGGGPGRTSLGSALSVDNGVPLIIHYPMDTRVGLPRTEEVLRGLISRRSQRPDYALIAGRHTRTIHNGRGRE